MSFTQQNISISQLSSSEWINRILLSVNAFAKAQGNYTEVFLETNKNGSTVSFVRNDEPIAAFFSESDREAEAFALGLHFGYVMLTTPKQFND